MGRKPVLENGKKDEILSAALKLFFENGYDGTSIRGIMKEAGGEISLFYYYFKSKDEVFDFTLDLFFDKYIDKANRLMNEWRRCPNMLMGKFFGLLVEEVNTFRDKYEGKIHRTIIWALKDRTLELMIPYIKEIMDILVINGASTRIDSEIAAIFIAKGGGSLMLYENRIETSRVDSVRKCINIIMGLDPDKSDLMFPMEISSKDVAGCLSLYNAEKNKMPWVTKDQFMNYISRGVETGETLAVMSNDQIVGIVTFEKEERVITSLFVKEEFCGNGIAERLIVNSLGQMKLGEHVQISVPRENAACGTPIREILFKMGFQEAEYETINGEEAQKLICFIQ